MCFLFDLCICLLRQAVLTHIHILYTILRPFLSGHFFEMGLTYQRVDVVQYSTLYYPEDLFQQSMWLRSISLYEQVQGLHSRSQNHTTANKRVWMYFSQDMMGGLVKNWRTLRNEGGFGQRFLAMGNFLQWCRRFTSTFKSHVFGNDKIW